MDNTLSDTFHTLSVAQWKRVAIAFEKKGRKDYAAAIRKNIGKQGFVHTLKQIGMKKQDMHFAVKIYDTVSVRGLKLYPDAQDILNVDLPKVLITRGEKNLQIRKIKHLGIGKHFEKIVYVPTFGTKKQSFKDVMKQFKVKPKECLVIGDRLEEEIKDANELGIPSVLVRRPGWKIKTGTAKPNVVVKSLKTVVKKFRL
jgi:HAD superfamily hydrolase (TIGR01509 family)